MKESGAVASSCIELPLTRTQLVPATQGRADERRLDRRVLIIDDNEDAANTTAMLIEDMGGDARVAYDGESALAMIHDYQPEVVLLDIGMRGWTGTRPVNGFVVFWATGSCLSR